MNAAKHILSRLGVPIAYQGTICEHMKNAEKHGIDPIEYDVVSLDEHRNIRSTIECLMDSQENYRQALIDPKNGDPVIRRYIRNRDHEAYQDIRIDQTFSDAVETNGLFKLPLIKCVKDISTLTWVEQPVFDPILIPSQLTGFSLDLVEWQGRWYGLYFWPYPCLIKYNHNQIENTVLSSISEHYNKTRPH